MEAVDKKFFGYHFSSRQISRKAFFVDPLQKHFCKPKVWSLRKNNFLFLLWQKIFEKKFPWLLQPKFSHYGGLGGSPLQKSNWTMPWWQVDVLNLKNKLDQVLKPEVNVSKFFSHNCSLGLLRFSHNWQVSCQKRKVKLHSFCFFAFCCCVPFKSGKLSFRSWKH